MCDDIPLRLCATREEAQEFARVLVPDDVRREAADVFDVGVSEVTHLSVVEFRDGAPMGAEELKNFDPMMDELRRLRRERGSDDEGEEWKKGGKR
jgi:hypothetical protein